MTNRDLRIAINYCIDRQQIIDVGYLGASEVSPLPMPDYAPLQPYKDQLLIDITSEGLRIQIMDEVRQPMFATGSSIPNERARLLLAVRVAGLQPQRGELERLHRLLRGLLEDRFVLVAAAEDVVADGDLVDPHARGVVLRHAFAGVLEPAVALAPLAGNFITVFPFSTNNSPGILMEEPLTVTFLPSLPI